MFRPDDPAFGSLQRILKGSRGIDVRA